MRFCLLLGYLFWGLTLVAQQPVVFVRYAEDIIDLLATRQNDGGEKIDGTPYLNENFALGEVYYAPRNEVSQQLFEKQTHYEGIPFRYNIFLDEMEYYYKDDQVLALIPMPLVDKVIIGQDTFLYRLRNMDQPEQVAGYFHLLQGGKLKLLLKYNKGYKEGQPAKALQDAASPKYVNRRKTYFLELENGRLYKINSIKKVIPLLGKHVREMRAFVDEHKTSNRNVPELKAFVAFFNSLPDIP